MVRTRAKKGSTSARQKGSSPESEEQSQESWKLWLMDFENELDGRLHKLKLKVQEEMETLDRSLLLLLAQIPSDEANLPSSQFSNVNASDSIESFDSSLPSTVKKGGKGFVTSTAFKPMPPPAAKTTRQSRTQTKRNRTSSLTDVSYPDLSSTRRMTRSSSQPRSATTMITDYQTPMNRPDRTMVSVTPKVDPYCPMPLKRYARQGEMAISLTGSPLMMTTSITEPNISLPLNNGQEVYSILPTIGPCPVIPSIDSRTREKLRILRENLDKILGD